MASLAGIPFPTYRNAESGRIPQSDTLAAIAAAHGIPETALFLDPDLVPKAPRPSPEEALQVVAEALQVRRPEPALNEISSLLSTLDENQRRLALRTLREDLVEYIAGLRGEPLDPELVEKPRKSKV